ncbi:hypothetical protein GVAV_002292 [Gurleya vavrai]
MTQIENILTKIKSKKFRKNQDEISQDDKKIKINALKELTDSLDEKQDLVNKTNENDRMIFTQDIVVQNNTEKLMKYKDNDLCIKDIIENSDLQIDDTLFVCIFKITINKFEMVGLNLIDESGNVDACVSFEDYRNFNFKVGDVLKINNFSMWKDETFYIILNENVIIEMF